MFKVTDLWFLKFDGINIYKTGFKEFVYDLFFCFNVFWVFLKSFSINPFVFVSIYWKNIGKWSQFHLNVRRQNYCSKVGAALCDPFESKVIILTKW